MAVADWKWQHIDWSITVAEYGYKSKSDLNNSSKVIVICTECKLPALVTTVISMRVRGDQKKAGQIDYIPVCKSCQQARTWARNEKFREKQRTVQAEAMRRVWMKPEYRANASEKFSEAGKLKWTNPKHRAKIVDSLRRKHAEDPEYTKKSISALKSPEADAKRRAATSTPAHLSKMRAILNRPDLLRAASERSKARWDDDDYRRRVVENGIETWKSPELRAEASAISASRWQDDDYRAHMLAVFNSEEHKRNLAEISKGLWSDEAYRAKMMAVFTDEYKQLMSDNAKELWTNPDYRDRMIAIFNSPEYKAAMSIAMKKVWDNDKFRCKMAMIRANQPRISSIQQQLYRLLGDLDVPFLPEGADTVIGHYVFDCLVPKDDGPGGILIECQGDYWHTRPGSEARDKSKFTYVDRYFSEYEIMYLWEHEFKAKGRVLERIKMKLGIEIPVAKFEFADLVVRTPTTDEVKTFLDAYHYIGKGRGGKCLGAYHNDVMVGVAVFSPVLRQNTAGQFGLKSDRVVELSRFCIHPSYHKKNFASWLIARSIKIISGHADLVVSYADTTVGHNGGIYKAAGFTHHHTVKPDYWYVDSEGFVMHKRTLYGRAVKMHMTEREFAEQYGYVKKWGNEKFCFIKKI